MKKMFFATIASFLLVCVSGFTTADQSSQGKAAFKKGKLKFSGAWITSSSGYLHNCDYVEHYYVAGGLSDETYEWYWNPAYPGWPTVYLGSGTSTDIQLGLGDELILRVTSESEGEYEYFDTAVECE